MERLIDWNALVTDLYKFPKEDPYERVIQFIDAIREAPAVDAVRVVRCKDCQFSVLLKDADFRNDPPWRYHSENCLVCCCNALIEDEPIIVEKDFFCAYGAGSGD